MENINRILNKYVEKILLIVLLFVSFLFCLFQFFDHDEFEAIHTAWKIIHGQIMFVDFFQQKPPFFHYTLIPLINLFGETVNAIFACKVYMYFLFLILVYASSGISISVFGKKTKFLTPIILISCTFFTDKLTEIRPDVLYMALSMLAMMFIFRNLRISEISLILCGILFGLSFAVLPKAVIYIIPITIMIIIRMLNKKATLRGLILYFLALFITIIPFFMHMFKTISLEDYYFFNFSMNFKFLGTFTPWKNLWLFFQENCPFLILAIMGFSKLRKYRQIEIGILAIVLFMSIFSINVPNRQYILPSVPFLAMIASNFICNVKILDKNKFIILVIITLYSLVYYYRQITLPNQGWQIDQIRYVLDNTKPDDKVYDGSIYFNIYRDDVNYFWFSVRPNGVVDTYKSMRPVEYDIYKEIEIKKPKFIYVKYLDINHELLRKYYIPTVTFPRLYIRKEDNE